MFNPKRLARGGSVMALLLAVAAPLAAQESENYRIESPGLNNGGSLPGTFLTSTNFRITLDALGDPVARIGLLTSPAFESETGFIASYQPPTEVTGLALTTADTLVWNAARGAASYVVYRGVLAGLPSSHGSCLQTAIPTTTATDPSNPSSSEAYFYLVSAANSLDEEATSGFDSFGTERSPTTCP